MKLNIANPSTGTQKLLDIDDEKKLRIFYDKYMSQEVKGDDLGEEFKGYVFRITGGNDKQGFPMKQGVLINKRVRLLMGAGHSCYRPRRSGERKRKSVRGCIVGQDLAVLSLVVVKQGGQDLPGLTDKNVPRRLGPKRASKIRKLFNLSKQDDVRKFVIRREIPPKEGKKKGTSKAPKIQRLVTPLTLQRKRRRIALKKRWTLKSKKDAEDYKQLLQKRQKESRDKRQELINKKRGIVKPVTPTGGAGKPPGPGSSGSQSHAPRAESAKKDTKSSATTPAAAAPTKKSDTKKATKDTKAKATAAAPKATAAATTPAKAAESAKKTDPKAAAFPKTTAAPAKAATTPAKAAEPAKKTDPKAAESTKKTDPKAAAPTAAPPKAAEPAKKTAPGTTVPGTTAPGTTTTATTATTTSTTATTTTTKPGESSPKPGEPAKKG